MLSGHLQCKDYCYTNFRLVWPCIMNIGWRERNQQDATNLMFIIKLLSQHVSGIIMPIIRRTKVCTAAYGVLVVMAEVVWSWDTSCVHCESYWSNSSWHSSTQPQPSQPEHHTRQWHSLVLLMMGIMMPETCWDKSLIINIRLVTSCWFLSLHPTAIHFIPCAPQAKN